TEADLREMTKMTDNIIEWQKKENKGLRKILSQSVEIGIEALGRKEFMKLAKERMDDDSSSSESSCESGESSDSDSSDKLKVTGIYATSDLRRKQFEKNFTWEKDHTVFSDAME
ncbi:unnamed protein product, partial [marine sediment metagenome]